MTAFSKIVRADEVLPAGFSARMEADEAARKAIAERLGIPAVEQLVGDVSLRRVSRGFELAGHFDAVLQRICVASLDLMQESLSEDFAIRFSEDAGDDADIEADAPEPIPPEGFDPGEILVQQLALAMDPYPHKEGAQSLAETYGTPGAISPFDVLKGTFAARRDKE